MDRRSFLKVTGLGGASAVALLNGGGRALADPVPGGVTPTAPDGLSTFTFLFPALRPLRPDPDPAVTVRNLAALAASMLDPNITQPSAGHRDNIGSGSIFTYLGQFIDHDLTLDLEPPPTKFFGRSAAGLLLDDEDALPVPNFESFRFDLSSMYAGGPGLSPQLYEVDKTHLRLQERNLNGVRDLPRNADGSAVLVEHRNDENEIVAQIHTAFLKFHNAVVDRLGLAFGAAQALVIQYYQWVVLHEFLPEIVGQPVVDGLLTGSIRSFYKPGNPHHPDTPVEWSTAAYRFGHSMVRKAYQVTTATGKLQVFNGTDADLHGGRPLPAGRQIDFGQFVPALRRADNTDALFNFPRLIDTQVSSGLFTLPIGGPSGAEPTGSNVLGFRNLVRGFFYGAPSGQDVAAALGLPVITPAEATGVPGFAAGTPLWYYILKESELSTEPVSDAGFTGGHRIGPVGGRIVADTFLGMLKADKNGLLHGGNRFTPTPPIAPAVGRVSIADLLVFAGVAVRP